MLPFCLRMAGREGGVLVVVCQEERVAAAPIWVLPLEHCGCSVLPCALFLTDFSSQPAPLLLSEGGRFSLLFSPASGRDSQAPVCASQAAFLLLLEVLFSFQLSLNRLRFQRIEIVVESLKAEINVVLTKN